MIKDQKKIQKEIKRNSKFINEFKVWLNNKGLVDKTIRKHLRNIDLYINDYLNYYEITKMEKGISEAYIFFSDWFIRKCLFATKISIKEIAGSIKKFYKCMNELGYISNDDYDFLYTSIKDNMDEFLDSFEEFNNFDEEWY